MEKLQNISIRVMIQRRVKKGIPIASSTGLLCGHVIQRKGKVMK
jgi:hypothetical protein